MRNILKAAVIAFGAAGALAALPAGAQPFDDSYGAYAPYDDQAQCDPYYGCPQQAYGDTYGGYCDPYYGCPDDYYDLPVYYGDVYWDGGWYDGPFFYRDYGGHRQFWLHGGWHYGESRGGHFGPALGRDYFRNHGFAGRSGFAARGETFAR